MVISLRSVVAFCISKIREGDNPLNALKAIVQKVVREGKHGPFAVATSDQLKGSVTFSLEPTVWKEKEWPEEGTAVFLEELRQKRAGWRAKQGRFWEPSDEQPQQTERSKAMQFKYPASRQFPFDEVCGKIVHALEARNWKVPGIKVEFYQRGTGDEKYRFASVIKGADFELRDGFGRDESFSRINIPGMELRVYSDESGPGFYLYVGDDWNRDRKAFERGGKCNSKLNGKPRIYLRYEGVCRCAASQYRHTHPGKRSPLLEHTNDLDREYDPEGDEPREFMTSELFAKFTDWLSGNVLRVIEALPLPEKRIDIFHEEAIPFPASIGPLFAFGTLDDIERITQGKQDMSTLEPRRRYGLLRNEFGVGEVTQHTPIDALRIPGYYRRTGSWSPSNNEEFVIRVVPKSANHIFVEDHGARDRAYNKARSRRPAGYKETATDWNRWYGNACAAQRQTRIPITEYDGKLEEPVVLIDRELSFDEVEVVSGPHKDNSGR